MMTTPRHSLRTLRCALLALPFGLVAACSDGDDPVSQVRTPTVARYAPSVGLIPLPNDILFSGSTDATLNPPIANPADTTDPLIGVSTVDGWSTVAPAVIEFTRPLDETSVIGGSTVHFYEVTTFADPTLPVGGPVLTIDRELVDTVDYEVQFPASYGGRAIALQPLVPLDPSTAVPGGNSSYMVIVTNGVTDTDGVAVARDAEYVIAAAPALGTDPAPPESVQQLNMLVNAQLSVYAGFTSAPADDVVASFTFTTQSVGSALSTVFGIANGQEGTIINSLCSQLDTCGGDTSPSSLSAPLINQVNDPSSFLGTASELAGFGVGAAQIYAGVFKAPYYLTQSDNSSFAGVTNDTAALAFPWRARYAPADGVTDRNVTRFNPLPIATTAQQMPLLISIPDETQPGVPARPGNGWPVAIFMHGITSNRTAMLGIAEAMAQAGVAMVAIDQPLHGVGLNEPLPDGTDIFVGYNNMLPQPDDVWERTFGLDLLTQSMGITTEAVPDGNADTSGAHFINLQNLAVTRDNLRQAVSDLVNLRAALAGMTVQGTDETDESEVHFIGHSLGGIVGTPFLALQSDVTAATLGMPGSSIPYLLDGSEFFGDIIRGGLAAAGVVAGTPTYDQYLSAAQTIVDTADPINYASLIAAGSTPIYLAEIVGGGMNGSEPDMVIPNRVTGAPFAGTEPLISALGLNSISMTSMGTAQRVAVRFTEGNHSTLLLPGSTSEELAAFSEMQAQVASFHASDGDDVIMTDTTVVQ